MSQSRFKVLNRLNHRWIRFSLRGVLIATAALALWLGQIVSRVKNQKLVMSHVQETGGKVWFETDQPRFVEHWLKAERIPSTVASDPNWFGTELDADYSLEENLHYIEVLVEAGDPIKDTFVDDDGLSIDLDPTVDTTLDKERKIIEAAGYEWDETIPGWKVPDGHVWDDVQKKWVPG